jgi:hypothetical protein
MMNTRLVLTVTGVLMGLALSACTAGLSASFDRLPEPSRAAYERCWEHMRQPICGSTSDLAEVTNCSRSSSSTYAAQGSEAERQEWLASHGCPRGVASSGGQR